MSLNRLSIVKLLAFPIMVFAMVGCGSDAYVKDAGDSGETGPGTPPCVGCDLGLSANVVIDTLNPTQYVFSVCDNTASYIGKIDNSTNKITQPLFYHTTDGANGSTGGWISETYSVPANLTPDGQGGNLRLVWNSMDLQSTGYIPSRVEVIDENGDLTGKPIEVICSALTGNYEGIDFAHLTYPISGANPNAMSQLNIKATAYVHSNDGTEIFPPVSGPDGSIWLRHNLGADYVTVGHPNFNPDAYPLSRTDFHAYGDLWQWGRRDDSHQNITHNDAYTALADNGVSAQQSNEPLNSNFITNASDWRVNSDDSLWRDINTPNQICPKNWRLASDDEWLAIRGADGPTANTYEAPNFMYLTLAGQRLNTDGGVAGQGVAYTKYWTSTVRNNKATSFWLGATQGVADSKLEGIVKSAGGPVRCRLGI